jgi:hypothetical protein
MVVQHNLQAMNANRMLNITTGAQSKSTEKLSFGYKGVMSGDRNTLFKMKELWCYMSKSFTNPEKYLKKIKKTERLAEYYVIVDTLFREQELQQEWS